MEGNFSMIHQTDAREETQRIRPLPTKFDKYVHLWLRGALTWYRFYFFLGILAVMLPAVIASGLIDDAFWTKIIALAAAAVGGLQFFLKCDNRADRFHAAYRTLNTAIFKYEYSDDFPISEVIDAYHRGEELIESAFGPVDSQHRVSIPTIATTY